MSTLDKTKDKLAKAARAALPKKIDIDDEDLVRSAMALELDIDPDDLKIEASGLESFRAGDALSVSIRGGGHKEWTVVQDEDVAEAIALASVLQDIESGPENFNRSFIESHIDTDRLRRDLEGDVENSNRERLDEERDSDVWAEARQYGMDVPDKYDEPDEVPDSILDDLAERITQEQLKDPMAYLEDIYGKADAVAQAIKIAGIDEKAAAEDAIRTDGWAHFLCRYDGNYNEAAGGLVYWRDN